ncbi:hypothetical protein [Halorubrum ezzemoulense]|uniref:hypothetical protein n=1 Tax=Halorubrum ezzemoulense TaxID=337243 RepID=UPI00232ACF30|nr:hypothetical protein [Halorubrum ezzemoulense]MDB9235841.1 hypothetical protein [Halorubrum ezzemoulense]
MILDDEKVVWLATEETSPRDHVGFESEERLVACCLVAPPFECGCELFLKPPAVRRIVNGGQLVVSTA